MTQAQKAVIVFVFVPLVSVLIMRVFSPSEQYPTLTSQLNIMPLLFWLAVALMAFILFFAWNRAKKTKI
jgi:hypothetical protein